MILSMSEPIRRCRSIILLMEKVAQQVAVSPDTRAVVCGSGIGISIAANKVPGARVALCYSKHAAVSRQHNNANILAMAGREEMMDDPVENSG